MRGIRWLSICLCVGLISCQYGQQQQSGRGGDGSGSRDPNGGSRRGQQQQGGQRGQYSGRGTYGYNPQSRGGQGGNMRGQLGSYGQQSRGDQYGQQSGSSSGQQGGGQGRQGKLPQGNRREGQPSGQQSGRGQYGGQGGRNQQHGTYGSQGGRGQQRGSGTGGQQYPNGQRRQPTSGGSHGQTWQGQHQGGHQREQHQNSFGERRQTSSGSQSAGQHSDSHQPQRTGSSERGSQNKNVHGHDGDSRSNQEGRQGSNQYQPGKQAQAQPIYEAIINYTYTDPILGVKRYGMTKGHFGIGGRVGKESGILIHVLTNRNKHHGCEIPTNSVPSRTKWMALVERGQCRFHDKIANAMKKGAAATIIYNNVHDNISQSQITMKHEVPNAIAVFIPRSGGERLKKLVDGGTTVTTHILVGKLTRERSQNTYGRRGQRAKYGHGSNTASSLTTCYDIIILVLVPQFFK